MRVRYQSLVWITSAALCGPSLAEASDRSQDTPPPSEARRPPVITNPSWERRPIPDYPETALARRVSSGAATLDCGVASDGALRSCQIVTETPEGAGFGAAALRATRAARLSPRTIDGVQADARVRFSLSFRLGR